MTTEVECCCPECGAEFTAAPEGGHRLLCGNSMVATDVERVLGGVAPQLMVTDPPYGVSYDPEWRPGARATGKVANDDRADWREAWALFPGDIAYVWHASLHVHEANDDRADWREAWALFPGDIAYVWHASLHVHEVAESLIACSFELRASIIWAKQQLQFSRGHYHWQHEPCWYIVRKGKTGNWHGDRKQTTLWQIPFGGKDEDARSVHSTQKPVECMKRPIENNSSPGQAVYEPSAARARR